MKPIIFTLTGPSCAGKSTLEKLMVDKLEFSKVVSDTTRAKREKEIDGIDYYFYTHQKFSEMKANNEFIESVNFSGNSYGVSVTEINRLTLQGKPIVIVVEPGGREQIKEYAEKNDVNFLPIYVGTSAKNIAQRFISRIYDELPVDKIVTPKFLINYSNRLEIMMTTEHQWKLEAEDVVNQAYAYKIFDFCSKNQEEVLTDINTFLLNLKA